MNCKMMKYGVTALALILGSTLYADTDRIGALEQQVADLNTALAALKGEQSDLAAIESPTDGMRFGGYGEIHANWKESGDDLLDIHRLVIYMGYDFADWISLTSEIELEHASTDEEYLLIEQLYVDFLLSDAFNVRAGRVLAPLGIVNQHHEPTLFNGVERPNVDKYIIPSTWMVDGVGFFGSPLTWLNYQVYAVAALDDTKFSGSSGIRSGRLKGRPGMNDGAITGRIDLYPSSSDLQNLRIGLSGYYGGTNNKNKGGDNTNNSDNVFSMVSADFEYDLSRLQLRGVVAHGTNSDAEDLAAGVGEEIFGWYLEAGYDVMPESCKSGKFAEAALIPFVRYERYDTQYDLPTGGTATGANDRTEVTVGISWLLTSDFVVKADAQFASNEQTGSDTDTLYNLGLGWVFH